MTETSSASTPDRYLISILQQSESLGLFHQEQIRRDQERLREMVAEFERVKTTENKRLQENIQTLDQEFRDTLVRLQEDFVSQAREASDRFKTEARNCRRRYEKRLETRAREMALELRSSPIGSDSNRSAAITSPIATRPRLRSLRNLTRPIPVDISPDDDQDERRQSANDAPTMPKTLGLILDWLSESKMKRPESSPFDEGDVHAKPRRLYNDKAMKDRSDGENVTNQTEEAGPISPHVALKPIVARRHALAERAQLPTFQSREISFVKSRLRSLSQSIARLDFDDDDEIQKKQPRLDPGHDRPSAENNEPRISESFRQRILAQTRRIQMK